MTNCLLVADVEENKLVACHQLDTDRIADVSGPLKGLLALLVLHQLAVQESFFEENNSGNISLPLAEKRAFGHV